MIAKLHHIWLSIERRNVGSAALASLLSKVFSAGIQALSVPIAISTLGSKAFGVFLVLTSVTNWIGSTSMGIGSSLTNEMAGNRRKSVSPAVGLILGAVQAVVISLICSAIFFGSLGSLLKTADASLLNEAELAGSILVLLAGLQLAFQPLQGMQTGLLQGRTQFLYQAFANFLVILGLLYVKYAASSSLVLFCVIITGIPLVISATNMAIFAFQERALFAWPRRVDFLPTAARLYKEGIGFFVINLASYAVNYGPIVYLAWLTGGSKFIAFSIYNRVIFFLMTFVWLLAMPLWPALVHARADGDESWIRRALYSCFHVFLAVAGMTFVATALFGTRLIDLWAGTHIEQPRGMALIFAFYYVLVIWREFLITVLISFDRVKTVARLQILQIILAYGAGYLLVPRFGEMGMGIAMVGSLAATSAWMLPRLEVVSPSGQRHAVMSYFMSRRP